MSNFLCKTCSGTGYQTLLGHAPSVGRCVDCEQGLKAACKEAARIIIAGFANTKANKQSREFAEEAERIIYREITGRMHAVSRDLENKKRHERNP